MYTVWGSIYLCVMFKGQSFICQVNLYKTIDVCAYVCCWPSALELFFLLNRYEAHAGLVGIKVHLMMLLIHATQMCWACKLWSQTYSLAPGRFEWDFRHVIFKLNSMSDNRGISFEIAFTRMSLGLSDGKSTLVKMITWYHKGTSHYLSQCWPSSM